MPTSRASVARRQARRDLDDSTAQIRPLRQSLLRPEAGWVSAIRQAIGMSRKDMAGRMGVNESTVARLEASECAETVQLDTLRRAADALDCDLVYALVPRRPLDEMVMTQGRRHAMKAMSTVAHTMLLEDQMPSERAMQQLIEELALSRIDQPGLWNDER